MCVSGRGYDGGAREPARGAVRAVRRRARADAVLGALRGAQPPAR